MAYVYGGKLIWGGSTAWQAPFACTRADVHVIGGGGAGHPDNESDTSNGDGGGGGGGGVGLTTVSLTPLSFYSVVVGGGGVAGPPSSQFATAGGTSYFQGAGVYVYGGGGQPGTDKFGGAGGGGTNAPGSPGQSDDGKRYGGSAGGCGSHRYGRTIDIDGISCVLDGGFGRGGRGSKDANEQIAQPGSQGAICIKYYYESPSGTISVNNSVMTVGDSVSVIYTTNYATSASITGIGAVAAITAGSVSVFPGVGTICYSLTVSGPGGTASGGTACVTVFPVPTIDSFYFSDPNPLSGDSVTLYWTTSNSVATSRKSSDPASGLNSTSCPADGSYTFTAGTGGVYNATLTVQNGAGKSVTSAPIQLIVRDETPNDFGWDDNLNNSALQNLNIESNTITIDGFGPTQYPSSNLPIKSNYPVQVMVNGDGIWRNVEQI